MLNSIDPTNKSALTFSIDHIDLVQKQVAPLKELFNLTSISYSKAFDDGSYMILINGHQDYLSDYFNGIKKLAMTLQT